MTGATFSPKRSIAFATSRKGKSADVDLRQKTIMVEEFILSHNLVDHLLRGADHQLNNFFRKGLANRAIEDGRQRLNPNRSNLIPAGQPFPSVVSPIRPRFSSLRVTPSQKRNYEVDFETSEVTRSPREHLA
jgi:hypothetical protein